MSREWRSPDLGPAKTLELGAGRLRYHDAGEGPPLVFVHGVIVNANLWRKVVARLSGRFRCLALDYPGFGLSTAPPGYRYTVAEHSKVALCVNLR